MDANAGAALEWIDAEDGTRIAAINVAGRSGAIEIKRHSGMMQAVATIVLGGAAGRMEDVALEQIAQDWIDRVGSPIISRGG